MNLNEVLTCLQVFDEMGYFETHQPCVGSRLCVKWQTTSSPVDDDNIVIPVFE